VVAEKLMALVGQSRDALTTLVFLGSGIVSSFLDNVVVVAALIPIIKDLIATDPIRKILWWALLFGACFGGNLTIIGSTANIIAVGALEKARKRSIAFWEWFKPGLIVSVITLVVIWLLLLHLPYYK